MKQYISYFKWVFLVTVVLGLAYAGTLIWSRMTDGGELRNTERLTEERVFDYGEVLTDEEENELRELIAVREEQTSCDIVLVTLNESLKEYAREIDPTAGYDQFVRIYAENFYDDNKFGYDMPIGDGVLLVDNWFREDDGKIYTWFCTTGKAKMIYGDAMVNDLLDKVYQYVESDPYEAYKAYVNEVYYDMAGVTDIGARVPQWIRLVLAAVAALIYIIVHLVYRKGRKTTIATTYVSGGNARTKHKEDIFIKKVVTTRHIERSNNSSGGGRSSGGGGTHGGGGRSR